MAVLTCSFFSETLRESTAMTVILPESATGQIGMNTRTTAQPPPVLYLLHGLSDDETIWTRRTSIERYVAPLGIAVVMPRAGRSFYTNEHHGQRYWDFISDELPHQVAHFFRVATDRNHTYVAGLSMGGYGAMKLALRHPNRYTAAASISGVLSMAPTPAVDNLAVEVPQVWGGQHPHGTDDDPITMLHRANPTDLPRLYQSCGTEDFLYEENLHFAHTATERGITVTTDLTGPGSHDWDYFDYSIQQVLTWMFPTTTEQP